MHRQRVARRRQKHPKGLIQLQNLKDAAAQDTREIGNQREARQHHQHGEILGDYQIAHTVEPHGLERIDFLGNLHRAEFGGKRRAGSPRNDDGRDERSQLARHGNTHQCGDVIRSSELLELVSALQGQYDADE